MRNYVCPVCGAYGVTLHEKLALRLFGRPTHCHHCGASLTLGLREALLTYAIVFVALACGLLFRDLWRQFLMVMAGLAGAIYWHLQVVPLVETARHVRVHH